ncbi:MAG: hypothetical protein ACYDBQ_01045 [Thermoplasmatota archaeon]
MNPASLVVGGPWDWFRLAAGAGIFLLPGIAAARYLMPRWPLSVLLAPVLGASLLILSAVAGAFLFGMHVTAASTALVALAWTVLLIVPLGAAARPPNVRREHRAIATVARRHVGETVCLGVAIALLVAVHSLPHLPGPLASSSWAAPADFIGRVWEGVFGGASYPYPIHVDEHYHMAQAASVARTGTPFVGDPYTGTPDQAGIFDLHSQVHERGFWVLLAQLNLLTKATLPTMARFLPALTAGYLGILLWAILRPAPGARWSAAFLIVLPTTPLFLGIGYLVPIAFGIVWIVAIMAIGLRATGGARLVAPAALITAAFFIHWAAAAIGILVALLCFVFGRGNRMNRAMGALLTMLPIVWIWPAIRSDAIGSLGAQGLPPGRDIFRSAGIVIPTLAAVGAVWAFGRRTGATRPHRVLAVLAVCLLAGFEVALTAGHTSDAFYYRQVGTFFLAVAALAGLGLALLGTFAGSVASRRHPIGKLAGPAVVLILVGAAIPGVLATHINSQGYYIFQATSWQAASDFAAASPAPGATFLSDPWQAPVINSLTGAHPYSVLYPGAPPVNGGDYEYYVATNGTDASWLAARHIEWVVGLAAPHAPFDRVGLEVFHVRSPTTAP